jgi:hypothetical protein
MNPENGNKPESQAVPLPPAGTGSRKPYGSPRLRSLGKVNVITLTSTGGVEGSARKKPQG